jgi:hypothetical protein
MTKLAAFMTTQQKDALLQVAKNFKASEATVSGNQTEGNIRNLGISFQLNDGSTIVQPTADSLKESGIKLDAEVFIDGNLYPYNLHEWNVSFKAISDKAPNNEKPSLLTKKELDEVYDNKEIRSKLMELVRRFVVTIYEKNNPNKRLLAEDMEKCLEEPNKYGVYFRNLYNGYRGELNPGNNLYDSYVGFLVRVK